MITMNEPEYRNAVQPSMISANTEIPDSEDIEVDDSFFDDEIDVATDINSNKTYKVYPVPRI